MKRAFVAAAFVLALAGAANASTVTYTITVNTTVSPMTWSVYGLVSSDSAGLGLWGLNVLATGDLQFLTTQNKSGSAFSAVRSSGSLTKYPQQVYGVCASQAVLYGNDNDPASDALVTQGLGIGTPMLLAGGTFSGTSGTMTVQVYGGASTLKKVQGGLWMGPGNVEGATIPTPTLANGGVITVNAPEPATLALLALGGAAMITRRRRR